MIKLFQFVAGGAVWWWILSTYGHQIMHALGPVLLLIAIFFAATWWFWIGFVILGVPLLAYGLIAVICDVLREAADDLRNCFRAAFGR